MKLLLFQAKRFHWKSFSKTLADVAETVEDVLVVFLHAEVEDETKPKLETKVVKNMALLDLRGLKVISDE